MNKSAALLWIYQDITQIMQDIMLNMQAIKTDGGNFL